MWKFATTMLTSTDRNEKHQMRLSKCVVMGNLRENYFSREIDP